MSKQSSRRLLVSLLTSTPVRLDQSFAGQIANHTAMRLHTINEALLANPSRIDGCLAVATISAAARSRTLSAADLSTELYWSPLVKTLENISAPWIWSWIDDRYSAAFDGERLSDGFIATIHNKSHIAYKQIFQWLTGLVGWAHEVVRTYVFSTSCSAYMLVARSSGRLLRVLFAAASVMDGASDAHTLCWLVAAVLIQFQMCAAPMRLPMPMPIRLALSPSTM
jgi:hypothetical protein